MFGDRRAARRSSSTFRSQLRNIHRVVSERLQLGSEVQYITRHATILGVVFFFLELKIAISTIQSLVLSSSSPVLPFPSAVSLSHTLSLSHFHNCSFFFYSLSNITWAREECNFSSFFSLSLPFSRESYTESPRAANVFALYLVCVCMHVCTNVTSV